MSSSLQAQLAALNGSTTGGSGSAAAAHAGSSFRPSKRHEEATGRGAHYSVQHGYSSASRGDSAKYKASILYAMAAQAADVSVQQLHEQCQDALAQLAQRYPSLTTSCPLLSTLLKSNNKKQQHHHSHQHHVLDNFNAMENVLMHLSLILGDGSSSNSNNAKDDDDTMKEQVLFVIEYLIRKFHIAHSNNKFATAFLWTFLVHHEQLQSLFHRCLQLVDLGRLQQQSYLWLRPYAAAISGKQQKTQTPPTVSRSLISQAVMRNPSHLLRHLCKLVTMTSLRMAHHLVVLLQSSQDDDHEYDYEDDDYEEDEDHQGVVAVRVVGPVQGFDHFLSWTAAVIVEGLAWLQRQSQEKQVMARREAVVHLLAPTVLTMSSYWKDSNDDGSSITSSSVGRSIRSWGYVVASSLAETMDLSDALVCQWSSSMVRNPVADPEDAWTTVIGMLLTSGPGYDDLTIRRLADDDTKLQASYMPLLLNEAKKKNQWIGCPMPTALAKLCASYVGMPQVLGRLHQEVEITTFIIGLIAKSVYLLGKSSPSTSSTLDVQQQQQQQLLRLIFLLVQDEDMRAFWKEHDKDDNDDLDLVASMTAWIVQLGLAAGGSSGDDDKDVMSNDDDDDDDNNDNLDLYRDILQAIYQSHVGACERGLTRVMQKGLDDARSERFRKLLQGIVDIPDDESGKGDSAMMDIDGGGDNLGRQDWQWLPPRVALEHANPAVRLAAIQRLVVTVSSSSQEENDDVDNSEEDDIEMENADSSNLVSSVAGCLLSRWSMDDDANVALAACRALYKILKQQEDSLFFSKCTDGDDGDDEDRMERWALETLSGVNRWCGNINDASSNDKTVMELQTTSFLIAGRMARFLQQQQQQQVDEEDEDDFLSTNSTKWKQLLLEALFAHLDSSDGNEGSKKTKNNKSPATILESVSKAILFALDQKAEKNKSSSLSSQARKAIMANQDFLDQVEKHGKDSLLEAASGLSAVELSLRRRCIYAILSTLSVEESKNEQKKSKKSPLEYERLALYSLGLSLLALHMQDSSFTDQNILIAGCLLTATTTLSEKAANLETLPQVALTLASVTTDDKSFLELVRPALLALVADVKRGEDRISPISILMEASLRLSASPTAIVRLVSLAEEIILSSSKDEGIAPWLGVVPALALLQHPESTVRAAAVSILIVIGKHTKKEWAPVRKICQAIKEKRSSAELGGSHFLSGFFAGCTAGQDGPEVGNALLKLCILSAAAVGRETEAIDSGVFEQAWLSPTVSQGSARAASTILNELQVAGESSFPLARRWELAGRPIFEGLLGIENLDAEFESNAELLSLAECVVAMLKGVAIVDSPVVISSGPRSGGGRSRSYSVGGEMKGLQPLSPYPTAMFNAVVEILGEQKRKLPGGNALASLVVRDIMSSKTWANSIFAKLGWPLKKKIACALLVYSADDDVDLTGNVFVSLPLDARDIKNILADRLKSSVDLSTIAILMDYVQENGERLKTTAGAVHLIESLFDMLRTLASEPSYEDVDGLDYTLQTTVLALYQAAEKGKTLAERPNKNLDDWVNTLMALQGFSQPEAGPKPLTSLRARSAALSLMTTLASCYPDRLLVFLLRAVDHTSSSSLDETFAAIVPVFWSHASSTNLGFGDLLQSVVSAVIDRGDDLSQTSSTVWRDLVYALLSNVPGDSEERAASVGALVAIFLALYRSSNNIDSTSNNGTEAAVEMMRAAPSTCQISSLLLMLRYVKDWIIELQTGDPKKEELKILPSQRDIALLAVHGPNKSGKRTSTKVDFSSRETRQNTLGLIQDVLQVIDECLLFDSVKKFVRSRQGKGHLEGSSLNMWQDLLLVQSVSQGAAPQASNEDEASAWVEIASTADENRERLQVFLPVDLFLASVISLIDDEETSDIQSRALRLVADRVLEVEASGPEGSLFIELIPTILKVLKNGPEESSPDTIAQQSAFVAIEHIARSLFRASSEAPRGVVHVVNALTRAASLCKSLHADATSYESIDAPVRQLISTIALSAATMVRVLGARSLPILPKLMNSLTTILALTNSYCLSCAKSDEGESLAQARLLQLSILRFLIAVTETMPQFLPHHLKHLLSGSVLLSSALRHGNDITLSGAAESLDAILPSRVPARLFVPTLTKVLAKCKDSSECVILLSMLKSSIETMSSGEAAAHKNTILGCVMTMLGREESLANRERLMAAGNDALLALILKLSEVQLRRVYTTLREWKGDFDKSAPAANAGRRYAFWTISASLAKELRSIFLPCLSMVINDAVAELEVAALRLVPSEKAVTGSGRKKRRLSLPDESAPAYDEYSLRCLQPLLLCLERSLRADALDGGNWIRADGSLRYNALLEPFGKLLRCKVGQDFPLPEGVSNGFQYLVEGSDNDSGNVVGSLVALGLAAGDEQLWKPLNYAVLEACDSNGRNEVKSAGLTCLLALIKALGEEYMVLLPECLPVLSELLEDSSDEISGMARDAVSMAEELLGESLEDSLR